MSNILNEYAQATLAKLGWVKNLSDYKLELTGGYYLRLYPRRSGTTTLAIFHEGLIAQKDFQPISESPGFPALLAARLVHSRLEAGDGPKDLIAWLRGPA
jgi:hypothetical protein